MKTLPEKYVITVGRQMGSGGRLLGRKLSERLGIGFYDKELLLQAAKSAGLSAEYFERNDERRPHFLSGLFSFNMGFGPMSVYDGTTSISDDALYKAQCDFMHRIAEQGPCVIVGRTADYVLRDFPNVVNIFIHASKDACIRRVMERDPAKTVDSARSFIEKSNKLRAGYYNFYTDKKWGDAASYDFTIDSSLLSDDAVVDLIIAYLQARFAQ
ncbi:MAG: cytidylate kinase-like family protein [Bacteroidales bacterium]|nr:cytidylate kinase-like family protein [Bacteroidales bacterium]MDY2916405.1 cytidylate kinase-like family protein [Muribaculaceae bacterium]